MLHQRRNGSPFKGRPDSQLLSYRQQIATDIDFEGSRPKQLLGCRHRSCPHLLRSLREVGPVGGSIRSHDRSCEFISFLSV